MDINVGIDDIMALLLLLYDPITMGLHDRSSIVIIALKMSVTHLRQFV